tara:strand:+ start:49111 stop:49392 length:282 start_codon:yes stop_codon:yes gene_type:complete
MNENFDKKLRSHLKENIPSKTDMAIVNAIKENYRDSKKGHLKYLGQTLIPISLFLIVTFSISNMTKEESQLEAWQKEVLLLENLEIYSAMEEQ